MAVYEDHDKIICYLCNEILESNIPLEDTIMPAIEDDIQTNDK